MKYLVAFDIGGTNNRAALISKDYRIIREIRQPTAKSPSAILAQSKRMFEDLCASSSTKARSIEVIGISLAGGIGNGRIVDMPNLKLKRGSEPEKVFGKLLGRPVRALNDMTAAAYGELHFGNGRGKKNFIALTISTGIGSGIVSDGRLILGASGLAGQIQSTVIDYTHRPVRIEPDKGNFELLASGSGLELIYRKMTGRRATAHEIQARAERGEAAAKKSFEKSAEAIGFGIVSAVNLLNPELVILSGSHIAKGRKLLMPTVKSIVRRYALSAPRIIFSTHSNATLLGAAKWAKDHL